jgi:DtxR family Mn-dependent transcriptional regulator
MKYAKEIYHRHQKIKEFLVKILNVDDAEAEENACRIEHVIDEHIFKKLSCFLDFILDSDTKCVNIDKFKSECDEN